MTFKTAAELAVKNFEITRTIYSNSERSEQFLAERLSGQSKETGLVIYLPFLAKVANLYYIIMTAFKMYWLDTVAKFISGTQETFKSKCKSKHLYILS